MAGVPGRVGMGLSDPVSRRSGVGTVVKPERESSNSTSILNEIESKHDHDSISRSARAPVVVESSERRHATEGTGATGNEKARGHRRRSHVSHRNGVPPVGVEIHGM